MACYSVAGLSFSVEGAGEHFKKRMTEYMLPLAKEGEHCFDYRVNIQKLTELPICVGDKPILKGSSWKVAENREKTIYRGLIGLREEIGSVIQFHQNSADILLYSPEAYEEDPRDFASVGYAFEEFALMRDRMVLHGSCIEASGKAIVFVAPSGTGKSTHTALWQQHVPHVRYINDDTPVLRVDEPDMVYACGSPWSGKSDLHSNIQAPLAAIVLLQRGEENQMKPLSGIEAFARILGETRKYPFRDSMENAANLCEKLIERVPVFELQCTISKEAVLLAQKVLDLV